MSPGIVSDHPGFCTPSWFEGSDPHSRHEGHSFCSISTSSPPPTHTLIGSLTGNVLYPLSMHRKIKFIFYYPILFQYVKLSHR